MANDLHEPQYRVQPEDVRVHKQLIIMSDSYVAAEQLWNQIQDLLRPPKPGQ